MINDRWLLHLDHRLISMPLVMLCTLCTARFLALPSVRPGYCRVQLQIDADGENNLWCSLNANCFLQWKSHLKTIKQKVNMVPSHQWDGTTASTQEYSVTQLVFVNHLKSSAGCNKLTFMWNKLNIPTWSLKGKNSKDSSYTIKQLYIHRNEEQLLFVYDGCIKCQSSKASVKLCYLNNFKTSKSDHIASKYKNSFH